MTCDICNDTGTGPDGSYCRAPDCLHSDLAHWRDQANELACINLAIQGERLKDMQAYQKLQRANHKLQYQFQTYGRHWRSCKAKPCTCGFDAVCLRGVRL